MRIAITGAAGLLGWHCAARLHAANCAARYAGTLEPFDLVLLDRTAMADLDRLAATLSGVEALVHFAGVNRGTDDEVVRGNTEIATLLVEAVARSGGRPHIVYANSTHSRLDSPYGRSKRLAGEILSKAGVDYTDLVLPHIFGECARPYYNNVTATLIDKLWLGEEPLINPAGQVELLHAGTVAQIAINAAAGGQGGIIQPAGRPMKIAELYHRLARFHEAYNANIFPALDTPFDLALFNSYRTGGYPRYFPLSATCHRDVRGNLFETSKADGPSQTFVSTTQPGQKRGDHFHIDLVERFMVLSGSATIRVRKVLTNEVQVFEVSGAEPVAIDMPPLHTHHIENTSATDVVTFFWAHRHFDRANPDTYADPVLRG